MKMKKASLVILLVAFLCCAVLAPLAQAQTTGTVVGHVKDPSGAVVPGALITITAPATGFSREVTTGDAGYYIVPSVPVGTYSVSAEKEGFKRVTRGNVVIDVAENVRVDITLQLGSRTEVVEVLASTVKIETRVATLGVTVDKRRIVDLPLNGRNFLQLAVLQPGATPGLQLSTNNTAPTPGGSANSPQVNGLRGQSNNYLLDGANNNESFLGEAGFLPPPDALQEFRILTNSYSAEYGRGGGSIISVFTQSGSN